jgi:uncharacterized membrane protein YhaH (DUF805 family)
VGILSLLFGFSGRVNRAQYWLGGIGAGVAIVVFVCVLMVIGGPVNPGFTKDQQLAHFVGIFAFTLIPAILVASWIGYALAWKRFHDRGKSGVWVFLPMPFSFMMMSSVVGAVASGADMASLASAGQPWATILWIIQLWFFVELGCMPGKQGPNKYGNPPGNGSTAPAAPGAPMAPAKVAVAIPGMKPSLTGAESAMDRAIAERAKAQPPAPAPAAARAAQPTPANGLRPATPGSFGRKVTQ